MAVDLLILLAAVSLLSAYAGWIQFLLQVWQKIPAFEPPPRPLSPTSVSIVIPARDEASGIAACLERILQQGIPEDHLEVVVVDDHSTDGTPELVLDRFRGRVRLLRLGDHLSGAGHNSYKKLALSLGIRQARGDLIVTTDADCLATPHWLPSLIAAHRQWPESLLVGPVRYHPGQTLFTRFQALDQAGMTLLAAAGIASGTLPLGSGANLAFPKILFERLGGYEGIDEVASGDDMLLIQKAQARGVPVHFLKTATAAVETTAMTSWRDFWRQRIRWASKWKAYRSPYLLGTQALVFALVVAMLACYLLGLWGRPLLLGGFLAIFLGKALADWWLLRSATRFLGQGFLMRSFFISEVLHLYYILLGGLLALKGGRYLWKGRTVK